MVRVQPLVMMPALVYSLCGFSLPPGRISRCHGAVPASLSPSHPAPGWIHSGCAWCQRRAQGCPALPHSHFPRNNPHKSSGGCIYWNPAVPAKFFPSGFSLITVLITSIPANLCFPLCCARAAHLHTESPLSVDRAWGCSQEFMRSHPQPASGLPCGLGK